MRGDLLQRTVRVAEQAIAGLTGGHRPGAAPQRRSVVGPGPDQAGVLGALVGCVVTDRAVDPRSIGGVGVAARALDGACDVDRRRARSVDLARGDGELPGVVDRALSDSVRVAAVAGRAVVGEASDVLLDVV